MSGTRAGGLKAKKTLLAKNPDHYKEITSKGGKAKVKKGFAANPELARKAALKSHKNRKETPNGRGKKVR